MPPEKLYVSARKAVYPGTTASGRPQSEVSGAVRPGRRDKEALEGCRRCLSMIIDASSRKKQDPGRATVKVRKRKGVVRGDEGLQACHMDRRCIRLPEGLLQPSLVKGHRASQGRGRQGRIACDVEPLSARQCNFRIDATSFLHRIHASEIVMKAPLDSFVCQHSGIGRTMNRDFLHEAPAQRSFCGSLYPKS